jgi:hypothetical protein
VMSPQLVPPLLDPVDVLVAVAVLDELEVFLVPEQAKAQHAARSATAM